MGQIANQMLIEEIFKLKEKRKRKKEARKKDPKAQSVKEKKNS